MVVSVVVVVVMAATVDYDLSPLVVDLRVSADVVNVKLRRGLVSMIWGQVLLA